MCIDHPKVNFRPEDSNRKKDLKTQKTKKQRRSAENALVLIDDMELLETPIQIINEGNDWVLVASPNKPPKTS